MLNETMVVYEIGAALEVFVREGFRLFLRGGLSGLVLNCWHPIGWGELDEFLTFQPQKKFPAGHVFLGFCWAGTTAIYDKLSGNEFSVPLPMVFD